MKIIGKRKLEDQKVYDIGLAEDHNFILQNGQVASNCFNKSHSFAYSVLSFRTAYLKAHYLSDFYAAELTSWDGQVDKMMPVINDARRHGIKILPPDVNTSERSFTATDDTTVRFGLAGVKGLGEVGILELLQSRGSTPFQDLVEFCLRVGTALKANNLVALAKAGALAEIEPDMNPLELEQYIPDLLQGLKKRKETEKAGQMSFFDLDTKMTGFNEVAIIRPRVPITRHDLLELEKEALGMYVSGSPLDQFRQIRESIHVDDIASLEIEDLYVTVLGRVTNLVVRNGRGGQFIIGELDDGSGTIPVKIWSNRMASCSPSFQVGESVVVRGRTSFYQRIEIVVDSVVPAMDELSRLQGRIVLHKLDDVILNHILRLPLGSTPIDLEISNSFRYRLGHFDVKPNYFEGI